MTRSTDDLPLPQSDQLPSPDQIEEDYEDGDEEEEDDDQYMDMMIPEEDDSNRRRTAENLNSLFYPPFDLMFQGMFENVMQAATSQNKWLLVNLQSSKAFDSYTLNRDTWRHETVADVVRGNFLFWQVDEGTEEGSKVRTYYKLDSFPSILVIEPITGMQVQASVGMVEPENLLQNLLLKYTDSNPLDYCVNPPHKQKQHDSPSPDCSNIYKVKEKENYEDKLKGMNLEVDHDDVDVRELDPGFPPLPEEPQIDDPKVVCKVRVRFPGGRRIQRRFLRSDPIQLLWSFCWSELEEAEKGRFFSLAFAASPGRSQCLDYASNLSFEESGVGNCMLSCTWD